MPKLKKNKKMKFYFHYQNPLIDPLTSADDFVLIVKLIGILTIYYLIVHIHVIERDYFSIESLLMDRFEILLQTPHKTG